MNQSRPDSTDSAQARRLQAARAGDQHEFARLAEPHRRELQVHCYRILGSLHEAEEMVQETMLRAWRRLDTFQERAPFRAWLYKIATNACLDALDRRPRRTLPAAAHAPGDPQQPIDPPITEPIWLEPMPDELVADAEQASPEARYSRKESVSLAFLTALQTLTPRQRAALILRDVLDWRAAEAAECLDLTVSSLNSALHRARTNLGRGYSQPASLAEADETTRTLLDRYVHAWEAADVDGLVRLLREDVTFSMPPIPTWFRGRAAVRDVLLGVAFTGPARTAGWRLLPTRANGGPAFACYQPGEDGVYRAMGVQLLSIAAGAIADVTTFMEPRHAARFGFPPALET